MDIDVSIRSAGLASASNAVFWGDELDHWANPAVLGYQRGLRYEWGRTQLVPGLATDVYLTSRLLKAGGGGVGVVFSQKPVGQGGVHLDYGIRTSAASFISSEQVDSWGIGVSAAQAFESLVRLTGREPPAPSRHADVSFGMNFKHIDIALGPALWGLTGNTRARDIGGLARITPLDLLDRDGAFPARLDLSYGYSILSYNDDAVVNFSSESARVTRHRRHGFALRLVMNAPETRRWMGERSAKGTFLQGLLPLLTIGATHDHATVDAGSGSPAYRTDGTGIEIAFANVLAYRYGWYADKTGGIDGATSGWSVGLPLGPWAGVRYERAQIPQARDADLPNVKRKAFLAWVDPAAIWKSIHRAG